MRWVRKLQSQDETSSLKSGRFGPRGRLLVTPPGSHIRRMNPRDALKDSGTSVRIHRMIRRGTSYGPELPAGVLDDDGADRGLMFVFLGTDLKRQFEFARGFKNKRKSAVKRRPKPVQSTQRYLI